MLISALGSVERDLEDMGMQFSSVASISDVLSLSFILGCLYLLEWNMEWNGGMENGMEPMNVHSYS